MRKEGSAFVSSEIENVPTNVMHSTEKQKMSKNTFHRIIKQITNHITLYLIVLCYPVSLLLNLNGQIASSSGMR